MELLLADPSFYRIEEAANPFAMDASGQLLVADTALAMEQWKALRQAYEQLGWNVRVMGTEPKLPDQVFVANPVFVHDGQFVSSRMTHPSRQDEVPLAAKWLADRDFEEVHVQGDAKFEGGGDLAWAGDVLLAGHGFRSTAEAGPAVAEALDVPFMPLELVQPQYYHLDTALSVLDSETVLWIPEAFSKPAQKVVRERFATLVVPDSDRIKMAANGHQAGKFIMEEECYATAALLWEHGYGVRGVPTSEFRKSGGSVYCMKQVLS